MLFKSQVYSQVSGSIGGITYAHNKGGMYARARSLPVNPNSPQQVLIRTSMTLLVNAWQNVLTSAQRSAWEVYGTNVPKVGPLGDPLQLSGQQWYIAANVPRLQATLGRVDAAPTVFNRGEQDNTLAFTASAATQLVTVVFDDNLEWAGETGAAMLVYISRPQNPSINFFKGPFRFAAALLGSTATPLASPQTVAVPFPVVAGQRLFVAVSITRADGRLTTRSSFPSAVGA